MSVYWCQFCHIFIVARTDGRWVALSSIGARTDAACEAHEGGHEPDPRVGPCVQVAFRLKDLELAEHALATLHEAAAAKQTGNLTTTYQATADDKGPGWVVNRVTTEVMEYGHHPDTAERLAAQFSEIELPDYPPGDILDVLRRVVAARRDKEAADRREAT